MWKARAEKGDESGICLCSSVVRWWQCSQCAGTGDPVKTGLVGALDGGAAVMEKDKYQG